MTMLSFLARRVLKTICRRSWSFCSIMRSYIQGGKLLSDSNTGVWLSVCLGSFGCDFVKRILTKICCRVFSFKHLQANCLLEILSEKPVNRCWPCGTFIAYLVLWIWTKSEWAMVFLFFRAFWHGFGLAAFVIWCFVTHLDCFAK